MVVRLAVSVAMVAGVASLAWAQFGRTDLETRLARPESFDGLFHYCRPVYRPNPRVSFDGGGQPNHLIVQLTSDELFQSPSSLPRRWAGCCSPGRTRPGSRSSLLKGGFLWVDDFWGSYAWPHVGARRRQRQRAHAIADSHGRVMVFMTHNTDVSDSWEREGEAPDLLPRVLRERLPRGDQCLAVCDDSLRGWPVGVWPA